MQEKKNRKTLQELTFKDNFMFAAVMMDEENAKGFLERALDIVIDHLVISYEKSIVYNPEYKGIRLDVYLKDDKNTHFDVEMQVANHSIAKRSRYYHSQIDMELLGAGIDYESLPEAYVIFICDFDPIGLKKYKYTIKQYIQENREYPYTDGSHTVFLSTVGKNGDEVSESLVNFLKYAGAGLEESRKSYSDEFVSRLQKSVEKVKFDREFGRRYMLVEELMKEEYNAGKEDGKAEGIEALVSAIVDFLSDLSPVSDDLESRIASINDLEVLKDLNKKAARATSIEEFEQYLTAQNY